MSCKLIDALKKGCRKQSVDGQAQLDVGGEAGNNLRAKQNFGTSYF